MENTGKISPTLYPVSNKDRNTYCGLCGSKTNGKVHCPNCGANLSRPNKNR